MARKATATEEPQKKEAEPLYEEAALARAIGINRTRVERARGALTRDGWRYDCGRVVYSKKGALALMDAVGVAFAEGPEDGRRTLAQVLESAKVGPPTEIEKGYHRFYVMRLPINQALVKAQILDDEQLGLFECTVIVGDNRNFVHGMELVARPVDAARYLYRMVGAPPRQRGRW